MRRKALDSLVVSGLSAITLGATVLLYRVITSRFSPSETDAFFLAFGVLNVVIAPAYNAISSTLIPALVERATRAPGNISTILGATIVWTAAGSLLATLLVSLVAAQGLSAFGDTARVTADRVQLDLLILGPVVAIQAVGAVFSAANQALGRYWVSAVAGTLQQLVTLAFVSFTLPSSGVEQLPAAFTIGALGYLAFLSATWPWRTYPMALTWRLPTENGLIVRLAIPLFMGSVAQQGALVGLRLFASRLAPGAVTAFDLSYRVSLAIVEVTSSGALAVALTEWSTAIVGGQKAGLWSRFRDTLALVMFAVLPIPVLMHALREPLIEAWLSPAASVGLPAMTAATLAVLLCGVPLEIAGRLYARLLLAHGRNISEPR